MSDLDPDALRLLGWIVPRLNRITPGRPETYLGYHQAHIDLGLEKRGETYGTSLQRQGLDSLAEWTKNTRKPAITGVVVDQQKFGPGDGYFTLFGKTNTDFRWWEDQVRQSLAYDWSPYLVQSAPLPPTPPIPQQAPAPPQAEDPKPPPREVVTSYQKVRDSAVVRRVKELHRNQCQVCGHVIRLPDGGFYSEGHHIRPLGGGHEGHDVEANVLCVCPNHHAELDLGLWDIEATTLRTVPGHEIGPQYVKYHNEVIRKRWKPPDSGS